MTVLRGDERQTTSMVTVEISPAGARTALMVTDQLVILGDGDTVDDPVEIEKVEIVMTIMDGRVVYEAK